ncbi:hypothetical protein, partial [Kocuria dechangensis]|uniref:hypothetical protein n=1 Tax=Kocuria dechangensis TaxID=1176249 RepID=UPI003531775B
VTATVQTREQLGRVAATIRRAASQGVQLGLRECDYNDDAAFAVNLGLGVVPDSVATIPADVRKAL